MTNHRPYPEEPIETGDLRQAAVGQSLLSSTLQNTPLMRQVYAARLSAQLVKARGWGPAYAAAVAARYVRLFGMQVGR